VQELLYYNNYVAIEDEKLCCKNVVDLKKLCCDKKLTRSKQGKRKRSSGCATRGYFNCNTTKKAPINNLKEDFF
jgi:hypothetical protein